MQTTPSEFEGATHFMFPKEVSELHIIPSIWFPYGVGISRGQFFYAAFVFVMYVIFIQKNRKEKLE